MYILYIYTCIYIYMYRWYVSEWTRCWSSLCDYHPTVFWFLPCLLGLAKNMCRPTISRSWDLDLDIGATSNLANQKASRWSPSSGLPQTSQLSSQDPQNADEPCLLRVLHVWIPSSCASFCNAFCNLWLCTSHHARNSLRTHQGSWYSHLNLGPSFTMKRVQRQVQPKTAESAAPLFQPIRPSSNRTECKRMRLLRHSFTIFRIPILPCTVACHVQLTCLFIIVFFRVTSRI